jgi:gliding motility-associated-like protein
MVAESIYGCTDTIDHPVTVFATPIANALIDTTMGCYPLEVVFENASIGGGSYEWVYGTGETSNTDEQFHTYTYYNFDDEPVTYNVTLNITSPSGCNSSDALTVDVLPLLDADFTAINQGCSPLTIDFINESSGALSYYWEFGDGETHTIANPQHTFYNETTEDVVYEVMLVAQSYYGCFDTTYMDVTVFATPFASFIATPESQTWPDATVELENNSIAGDVNYTWDMGDGTVLSGENPGPYTYGSWGVYTIELEISNGFCSDVVTQSIEILAPEPIANFEGPASGCGPLTVAFTDMSEYAASYYWNFGDGGVATIPNPVYTYYQPGTYTVTLTVQGFNPGDSDTMVREEIIEVYPNAVAAFTVAPSQVMVPGEPMYAINLSQNADTYEWNFGDGGSSTDENPVYVYQDPGFYSIELIANNEWNCPDTTLLVDIVEGIATGEIEFPNAFTPNTSGSNGGLYDPTSYNNDVFFPIHNGVEEFQLQIFNRWGELLFESTEVGIGWDGYYKNELCKQDVYAWKAKVRFVNGEEVIQAGDVTLLIR